MAQNEKWCRGLHLIDESAELMLFFTVHQFIEKALKTQVEEVGPKVSGKSTSRFYQAAQPITKPHSVAHSE